jgi:3-carboxy-cis,cis-muconate cycloisomerase
MATDSTSGYRPTHPTARRSSSRSEGLLDGIFGRGDAAAAAGDGAFLQALLDVEAAHARACAREDLIPEAAAETIAAACRAERFDAVGLAEETARHAQPVVGLVAALRHAVGPDAAEHVHHGATSQDILDTALMLVARRALAPLVADLTAAADACASLAEQHATTPIIGRTLLQQGVPTTFGLKAAGWMTALDEAAGGLTRVRGQVLAVQLGGPVGALDAPGVAAAIADALALAVPVLPWHTDRRRPAELAAALGAAAGAAAKLATDVVLLSQNEIAEVREGGSGGRSSSMAHKRNPVASVSVLACAHRVPGLVATMLAAMPQEHERAAGRWQAEWPTLLELLRLTGSAGAWAAELAGGLEADPERMATNLAASPAADGDSAGPAALVARALAAHRERSDR